MATKYNIKIENIPLYENLFEELVDKETQSIDTSGIPPEVEDGHEWLRFCQWQLDKGMRDYNSLIHKFDNLIAQDYFHILNQEQIGVCEAIGFKQEYDAALFEIASEITSSKNHAMRIMNNLYSKIYYPISKTSLSRFREHVAHSVEDVAKYDPYLRNCIEQNSDILGLVFNLWLSQMVVHEEATDNIERLEKEREIWKMKTTSHPS